MSSKFARIYMKVNNPHGGNIPGVPLAHITHALWEELADWQKTSVDGCGFYYNPATPKKVAEGDEPESTEPTPEELALAEAEAEGEGTLEVDPNSEIPGNVASTEGEPGEGTLVGGFIEQPFQGGTLEEGEAPEGVIATPISADELEALDTTNEEEK